MTLTLELSPAQENALKFAAQTEGLSVTDYILRRLFSNPAGQPSAAVTVPASGRSDDEKRAVVLAYVNLPREEIVRLHAPDMAHLQAKSDATANATPEEIAEAEAEWQAYKKTMNEYRRSVGEQPLYRETEKS